MANIGTTIAPWMLFFQPLVLITLFVQVIAVTLLPAALVFLVLLLNNEEIMGKYKNTLLQNIIDFSEGK